MEALDFIISGLISMGPFDEIGESLKVRILLSEAEHSIVRDARVEGSGGGSVKELLFEICSTTMAQRAITLSSSATDIAEVPNTSEVGTD